MSNQLDFGDELPCGGYVEEDKVIQNNMKILSDEASKLEINVDNQKERS